MVSKLARAESRLETIRKQADASAARMQALMTGAAASFAGGFVDQKFGVDGQLKLGSVPVVPAVGAVAGLFALSGKGNKRTIKMAETVSVALTAPYLAAQGRRAALASDD